MPGWRVSCVGVSDSASDRHLRLRSPAFVTRLMIASSYTSSTILDNFCDLFYRQPRMSTTSCVGVHTAFNYLQRLRLSASTVLSRECYIKTLVVAGQTQSLNIDPGHLVLGIPGVRHRDVRWTFLVPGRSAGLPAASDFRVVGGGGVFDAAAGGSAIGGVGTAAVHADDRS